MLKIFLIISLGVNILFSNILKLSEEEKETIKNHPNKNVIAKRFSNYYKFLHEAKNFSVEKKIIRTNIHLNKILPKYEKNNNWSTPKQFLINGYGDCEDYVIAKYFSLLHLGFDSKNFYLGVVKVKASKTLHMVLMYLNKNNDLLVLDNLSWRVLPLNQREDLDLKYAFNEYGSYLMNDGKLKKEENKRSIEVKTLKKLISEE